jgi:hypothetical protein
MNKLFFVVILSLISNLCIGQWTKQFFVDEFGDTTKQTYLGQKCLGTFSNSATTDSELTAYLVVYYQTPGDYLWLRFELFEYNNHKITNREQYGVLKIKTANDEISQCTVYHDLQVRLLRPITGKAIRELNDDEALIILNKLKHETAPIKFYIVLQDGSAYNFKVDPQGFAAGLTLLK